MADFYKTVQPDGCQAVREATVSSTGVAQAGDIIALDGTGKIDSSLLPPGIGDDLKVMEAFEDIGAGDFVNIFDDIGTPKIRLADNSNGRQADGFVLTAITTGSTGNVYFEGANNALTGLTAGDVLYLGTAGAATSTAPDLTNAGTAAGTILQKLGTACAATEMTVEMAEKIVKQ